MDMDVKRLDHLGLVAGVIKDLELVEAIDERLQKDPEGQEHITPGEAIAGMVINGLGFSSRPLSLTPAFFKTKALETLFRRGVNAEHFNRHRLGRVLDEAHEYGHERLFYELASRCCERERIDVRFNSEDTTTFSLTGEYAEDTDEHTIRVTHGYSKDHRPDLKQVVHELLVSQDGGVPLFMKAHDGNASDNKIFQERAQALTERFRSSDMPRYLIADSKLYTEKNASNLKRLPFITRIPGTIQEESAVILEAFESDTWKPLEKNRIYTKHLTHYDIAQRWMVVFSEEAHKRAEKAIARGQQTEKEKLDKQLWHLSKQAYGCVLDAKKALEALLKPCHYHVLQSQEIVEKKTHSQRGRPKAGAEASDVKYTIIASIKADESAIQRRLKEQSCFVVATNVDADQLEDRAVVEAYKRQNSSIENMGFRFLKDPLFFTSSLFLKKPSRIMGLLLIMTLALLVYAIAQRRLRSALRARDETLPNQIRKETQTPTLRWVFQLMDGIHVVTVKLESTINEIIEGLDEIKRRIISYLGEAVMRLYGLGTDHTF